VQVTSQPVRRLRTILPNLITIGAILAGYLSVVEAFNGAYMNAAGLILVACLLDMLDGRVARAVKGTSEFGVEFDSLADMVNYGVAPALLYYLIYFKAWGVPGAVLSFLPVACAGIRLARFNTTADPDIPTKYFVGLPTTIAAVVMAGFIIFAASLPAGTPNLPAAAAVLTVFTAVLMVSDVQYEKSNILSLRYIRKTRRVITASIILASLLLVPQTAFFAWGLLYIIYGAARSLYYTLRYGADKLTETEIDYLV
jgi:CDP-diacylglycerol---serine O-phosphatidyltransferase